MTKAFRVSDRAAFETAAAGLKKAFADLDELLGCDQGFLLGAWIQAARQWSNATDAPASYYEWQARSQVSTWWPVPPSANADPATFTKLPFLDSYANKHWNGLVRDFYAPRVQCFLDQAAADFGGSLNMANLTSCVVHRELAFTQELSPWPSSCSHRRLLRCQTGST